MAKSKFHQVLSTYKCSDPTCDPDMEKKGRERRELQIETDNRERMTIEIYKNLTKDINCLTLL